MQQQKSLTLKQKKTKKKKKKKIDIYLPKIFTMCTLEVKMHTQTHNYIHYIIHPRPEAVLAGGRRIFFSYDIFVHGSKFQFIDGINLNLTHVCVCVCCEIVFVFTYIALVVFVYKVKQIIIIQ